MTTIEKKVQQTRFRLNANRWLHLFCSCITIGAGVLAAVVLVVRLYDWPWPLGVIAAGVGVFALIVSVILSVVGSVSDSHAAAALDEAAGLHERISSGIYCREATDPFAQAVVADAESIGGRLTVGQHVRYKVPRGLGGAGVAVVIACGMLLVPAGVLVADAKEEDQSEIVRQTAAVISKRTDRIKHLARTNPELKKLVDDLDKLAATPDEKSLDASQMRRVAVKKLDKMQDVLRQRKDSDRFSQAKEFKKMLRALNVPDRPETPTSKLAKALAAGDFKNAQQQIKEMREQLAKLSTPEDAQKLKEMQQQLDKLAKKLENLANNKKLTAKLLQAGLKKKDIERLLKQLTKKDIEQIKKQLQKQGMNQKEIDKLAKQLQKRKGANALAKQLGEALRQASQSAGAASASSQLAEAANQLGEMETLEMEMSQVDSMIADMQEAKNELGQSCSRCNGTGKIGGKKCPPCNGSGNGRGMGPKRGGGRGGIAKEDATRVNFVKRREKVKTGRGAIVGQYLVDGEQVKGGVSSEASEIVTAAERDAVDAMTNVHIPRRYHQAVKGYFSDLAKRLGGEKKAKAGDDEKDTSSSDSESNREDTPPKD